MLRLAFPSRKAGAERSSNVCCLRAYRRKFDQMKRKGQTQLSAGAAGDHQCSVSGDLAEHSKFFDSLVELVPAKYYFEAEEPLLNLKYLKKADRAAAKRALKEQYRKNKRARLDPDTAQTSLDVQRASAEQQGRLANPTDEPAAELKGQAMPPRLNLHSQTGPCCQESGVTVNAASVNNTCDQLMLRRGCCTFRRAQA